MEPCLKVKRPFNLPSIFQWRFNYFADLNLLSLIYLLEPTIWLQVLRFVVKHIKNKHEAVYQEQLKKVEAELFYHNYVTDPHRIRPPPPPGVYAL